jgi:hypothetical protein
MSLEFRLFTFIFLQSDVIEKHLLKVLELEGELVERPHHVVYYGTQNLEFGLIKVKTNCFFKEPFKNLTLLQV